MSAAQVHAVEHLADFEAAVRTFADKAKNAMSANQIEIRRAFDFLEAQLAALEDGDSPCRGGGLRRQE